MTMGGCFAPTLQIRNRNGGAWTVHAEFPDGSVEEISGFRTENDANEWIATSLQPWLDQRRLSGETRSHGDVAPLTGL